MYSDNTRKLGGWILLLVIMQIFLLKTRQLYSSKSNWRITHQGQLKFEHRSVFSRVFEVHKNSPVSDPEINKSYSNFCGLGVIWTARRSVQTLMTCQNKPRSEVKLTDTCKCWMAENQSQNKNWSTMAWGRTTEDMNRKCSKNHYALQRNGLTWRADSLK